MNPRHQSLPPDFTPTIAQALDGIGFRLTQAKRLAEAVLRLSDHYTQNPTAATPWAESWAQAASIAYYFPLNYARNRAVAREAERLGFFEGITHLIDFGSGTGSGLFAFADAKKDFTALAIDVESGPMDLARRLLASEFAYERWIASDLRRPRMDQPDRTLILASYSLTELEQAPEWFYESEALAILEPSTREDGRRLMALRDRLIERGYQIWAPCTHARPCPLLHRSDRDWCHDRIHWDAPSWFLEIEKHLPMKNRTLTYSYLLARKSASPPTASLARLVGDQLPEKGKTRIAVCRGEDREFLAWFPQRMSREDAELELERGHLVRLDEAQLQQKSDEWRLKSASAVSELPADADPRKT